MSRTKGSGKGVKLAPNVLDALKKDVLDVGCRAVARKVGCSQNYISMIINGGANPSPQQHSDMKQAVRELREGNVVPIQHEVLEAAL